MRPLASLTTTSPIRGRPIAAVVGDVTCSVTAYGVFGRMVKGVDGAVTVTFGVMAPVACRMALVMVTWLVIVTTRSAAWPGCMRIVTTGGRQSMTGRCTTGRMVTLTGKFLG